MGCCWMPSTAGNDNPGLLKARGQLGKKSHQVRGLVAEVGANRVDQRIK